VLKKRGNTTKEMKKRREKILYGKKGKNRLGIKLLVPERMNAVEKTLL